jgi:hypothetical protein
MSSKSIISTVLVTGLVALALTACDDNNNRNCNASFGGGAGVDINVLGAIAEGGDGGDGGNVANQGGQIAQDGSAAVEIEEAITGFAI